MTRLMSAELVVETLINGRQAERMAAQSELETKNEVLNPDLVRRLILEALSGPCAPVPKQRSADDAYNGARCWLLGSLAYVPASADEPERTLRQFVQETHEWNWWARYWALEALYLRKPDDLQQICREHILKGHGRLAALSRSRGPSRKWGRERD